MTQTNTTSLPHYRLTLGELKAQFKAGLIKAASYLLYLIKSTRRDGWKFRIPNVRSFCLEHGMSKSSFYRAKAQLIAAGLLREEIIGAVNLWVPGPGDRDDGDEIFSETEKSVPQSGLLSHICDSVSHICDSVSQGWESDRTPSQATQEVCEPSDLFQIKNNSLSLSEREPELTGKEKTENPPTVEIPEDFRIWLLQKAKHLPEYPTLIERWITAQAKKPEIQKQFFAESRGIKAEDGSGNVPPPAPAPNFSQIETAITQAHLRGDRQWMAEKLTALISSGYAEQAAEMCSLNRPWKFKVNSTGEIVDRS